MYKKKLFSFLNGFKPENYEQYCALGNYLPGKANLTVNYTVPGMDIFNKEMGITIGQPAYDDSISAIHQNAGESWGNALRDAVDKAISDKIGSDEVMRFVDTQIKDNYKGVY